MGKGIPGISSFVVISHNPSFKSRAETEDRLHRIGQKNTVFAYYLIGKRTLDEHVANILVDKSYEIDAIMDESHDSYENKEKAKELSKKLGRSVTAIEKKYRELYRRATQYI